MRAFFLLSFCMVAIGCGIDRKTQEFAYQYNVNGCDTGKRVFKSKEDYCKALLDDTINNGCARSAREKKYEAECQ